MDQPANIFHAFTQNGTNCQLSSASIVNQTSLIAQCQYLQRLVNALNVYETWRNIADQQSLSSFFYETYPITRFIDDIKHYKTLHSNDTNQLYQLQKELLSSSDLKFIECSLKTCKFSRRHFSRNYKKITSQNADSLISFYCLEMDNLHFNLFHLFESNYRQQIDTMSDNDADYMQSDRIDVRNQFNRFNTATNKYNIDSASSKINEKGDQTFCDSLFEELNYGEKILQYILDEEFETESINDDFEEVLFHDRNNKENCRKCNFYGACNDERSFFLIQNFIQKYKS